MTFFEYKNHLNEHEESYSEILGTRYGHPQLSIMIPTFRRPDYLKKAVYSSLSQITRIDFEVVVIDNDQDEAVGQRLLNEFNDDRLCYYSNSENIGMFGNWNRCIRLARGEWVTILSDDDELDENYVEDLFRACGKIEGCGAITCNSVRIDEGSCIIDEIGSKKGRRKLVPVKLRDFYLRHPVNIFGCMFRKDAAEELGGFDEKYYPCSDAVFLIGMCLKSKLYYYDKSLFRYRWAVNESQKVETQLSFVRFNNMKSMIINDNYVNLPMLFDKVLRSGMIDYTMDFLIKKRGYFIERSIINEMKTNMDLGNYNRLYSILYHILLKIRVMLFKYRGIKV